MKKFNFVCLTLFLLCLSMSSCQKMVIGDDGDIDGEGVEDERMVRFNVVQFEQMPFADAFASRGTDVKEVCSRISLVLYQNGKRVKQINQTIEDENFGQFKLVVPPATYKVVLIAHSGTENPTLTNPERITFKGVTDTFYYCDDLELVDGGTYDIKLRRAVAMVRFVIADQIPSNVALMHFYYIGGSSTFDAVHGCGSVNSRQSEIRKVTESMHGKPAAFEVYTFPHADNGTLKMQVTAHDAGDNVLRENKYDVEVVRNRITKLWGSFFGGEIEMEEEVIGGGNVQLNLYSEDEWEEMAYMY